MSSHPTPAEIRQVGEELADDTVVGRFRIDGRFRDGGMSILYLAEPVDGGGRVAIKVLHARHAQSPEILARFDREAAVMGRLADCPNVVSVLDVGSLPDGRRWIATEFVRGIDLEDLLSELRSNDERMTIDRACRLMRDVARGIDAAHRKQIVHRDLKPANVMIEEQGQTEVAKVIDFGVSADLGAKGQQDALTAFGSVIGTLEYMAPEQAAGLATAPTFDIYAMGAMMFEALTSETVPRGGWKAGRLPDVATLRKDIPAELNALVRECLDHDATKRPQTAAEVAERLERILATMESNVVPIRDWADDRPTSAAGSIGSGATPVPQPSVVVAGRPARTVKPGSIAATEPGRSRMLLAIVIGGVLLGAAIVTGFVIGETVDDDPGSGETAVAGVAETPTKEAPAPDPAPAPAEPEAPTPPPEVETPAAAPPEAAPPSETPLMIAPDVGSATPAAPKTRPRARNPEHPEPPAAAVPASETERCRDARADAKAAKARFDWRQVIRATADRECWASSTDRRRLRVEALLEQKRFRDCVDEAGGSTDAAIVRMVKFCRKRLDSR